MNTVERFIKSGVDPFAEDPLPTAYYHPSLERKLNKKERKICLSPERPVKLKPTTDAARETTDPSPGAEKFLQKTNSLSERELPTHDTPSPRDTSSKFNESWASSERPSTIVTPEYYRVPSATIPPSSIADLLASTREMFNEFDQKKKEPPPPEPENSTLARYIHRFRYGEPKSREDRKTAVEKTEEFWWLSPTGSTSTPTDERSRRGRSPLKGQRKVTRSPKGQHRYTGRAGFMDKKSSASTISSDTSPSLAIPMYVQNDRLTLDLQDRAQKLLDKSESLSEPRVSSEGIGSISTTSTYRDEEPVYRHRTSPIKHSIQDKENIPRSNQPQGQPYRPRPKLAPEDDILYQWRLRRKLEVARQRVVDPTQPTYGSGRRSPPVRLSPKKSKDALDMDDVDSRLSEFRQRMAQQRSVAQISISSRQPIRTAEKESSKESKGSDPIPQSIATQTSPKEEGTSPTDLNDERGPSIDFGAQERESSPTRLALTPVKQKASEHSQTPIASPHVRRDDESGDENTVTPHLHLMCDLLPCPHQVTGERLMQAGRSPARAHPEAADHTQDDAIPSTSEQGSKFTDGASPSRVSKQLDFEDSEEDGKDTSRAGKGKRKKKSGLPTGRDVAATKTSTPKAVPGSPISTAIGQVIGNRLFLSPQKSEHSSPRSSIDSLPTMHSSPRPQRLVEGESLLRSSSDSSEESEDDELLKMLYRKRTHYEEQLKHIDQLLVEKLRTDSDG